MLLAPDRVRRIQTQLCRWGAENFQVYPWRKPLPLWKGLIAEVMLQRTRASQASSVFKELDGRYRTAEEFGHASSAELDELFAPLGLHWRIELMHEFARHAGRSKGRLSRSEQTLQQLPGVGPYAAAAALSLHAGYRAVIVDANVVRVLSRLVGMPFDGETRRKKWLRELADRLTPQEHFTEYNYALIDLAMTVCSQSTPKCPQCPLREQCATGGSASRRQSR